MSADSMRFTVEMHGGGGAGSGGPLPPAFFRHRPETLRVKRLTPTATLPTRAHPDDIGLDLCADTPGRTNGVVIPPGERRNVGTGIAVAVPAGHYGRIAPRSGLAKRHGADVLGGVVDAGYRGELVVMLLNTGSAPLVVAHGDRIAQLVLERASIMPAVEVDKLDETERSAGAFGSTGR